MKSFCDNCNNNTNHEVLKEVKTELDEREQGWWEEDLFQIIKCKGCDSIRFRKLHTNAQYAAHADEGFDPYSQIIFPKKGPDSLTGARLNSTPSNIKNIYEETISAYNNQEYIYYAAVD